MKKRFIAALCALCIISGSSYSLAAYPDVPEDTNEERIVDIISDIGIMTGYEDGSFKPSQAVTRAEFVTALHNAVSYWSNGESGDEDGDGFDWMAFFLGTAAKDLELIYPESEEEAAAKGGRRWTDVDENHWAYDKLVDVANVGVINGYPDGSFRPENPVTYNEAIKIILTFCGYKAVADQFGGYPDGYIKFANDNGLFRGLSATGDMPLSRMDVATLIYNSFELELVSPTAADKKTFLNDVIGIYILEGTLSSTDITSIYSEERNDEYVAEIGGVEFSFDETQKDIRECIGREVRVFLKKGEDDEYSLKSFELANKKEEVTVIDIELFEGYENNTFYYRKSEESLVQSNRKVRGGAVLIYNGKYLASYNPDTFSNMNKGTITVIEKSNLDFDIIVVENFESGYIGEVNEKTLTLIDRVKEGTLDAPIEFYDEDNKIIPYSLFDSSGNPILYEDLGAGAINYYKSDNYIKLYYTSNKVSGNIKKVFNVDDEQHIKLDDVEYTVSNAYSESKNAIKLESGIDVTAYTDMYGEIVWIESGSSALGNVGYFVKAYINEDTDEPMLEYYDLGTKSGVVSSFTDTIKFSSPYNKKSKLSGEAIVDTMREYPGVFSFTKNNDGKIKSIEIPLDKSVESDETRIRVMLDVEEKGATYNYGLQTFIGNGVYLDSNTTVLRVPLDVSRIEKFSTESIRYFQERTAYVKIYNFDKKSARAKLVVMKSTLSNTGITYHYADSFVVTNVEEYWDDAEQEIATQLTLNNGSASYTLIVDNNYVDVNALRNAANLNEGVKYQVGVGDIVMYKETDGKITDLRLVYNADEKNPAWYGATTPEDKTTKVPEGNEDYCDVLGNICGSTGFESETYENSNPIAYHGSTAMVSGKQFAGHAYTFFAHGYAYSYYDNLMTMTTQNLSVPFDGNLEKEGYYYETVDPTGCQVVVISKGRNNATVTPGTLNDIKTYEQYGTKCSRIIVMHTTGFALKRIYIINDE